MTAQIFMIVASNRPEAVRDAIHNLPEGDFFDITHNSWVVSFDGTTRALAEHLGIRQGKTGSGVVAAISGYSGRATGDLWDWFKLKWPSDG